MTLCIPYCTEHARFTTAPHSTTAPLTITAPPYTTAHRRKTSVTASVKIGST